MSQQNVNLVRRWILELGSPAGVRSVAGGGTPLEAYWHHDAVIVNFEEGPLTKPYQGFGGVRQWVSESFAEVDDARLELEEILESGPAHVVFPVRFHGKMRLSGIPLDFVLAVLFRFRDGKIVYCQGFTESAKALDAVGLREHGNSHG